MNKPQKTNQYAPIVKGFSIILGGIAICCLFVTVGCTLLPYENQYNYSYVGMNFAEALEQNNSRLAHKLAVSSQWERIDEWMENHEPLHCPFSWDFDANVSVSGGILLDEERAHSSYFHSCYVKQYYEFEIAQIVLQRQNGRWQVVDWSEVKEMKE